MPLVRVSNLSITLDQRPILRDVNFEVDEGEAVAIIGPNGSGKTVLVKAMLGILPYEGEIVWNGAVTRGYVPQKIDADRSVPLNVRNLLESKAAVIGRSKAEIAETIGRLGLTDEILTTQIGHLSGGQFQRALIAFALLGNPQIIFFDEPTASMDEPGEEQMYHLIHRLHEDLRISPVVVSHDLTFVYRYADRVLCLNRAGICFGPPRGVLTAAVLTQLFGQRAIYEHGEHL
ncbi:MAG TPA: metal ABC transporter ATP-binding protein [Thermoanaerobaculia bacterium]|jgi:zinc transport system ATP-binding protein|nr:metal ABC transporter ATP-binding protein [Thermoanaerobaculia bacterium]